MDVGEIIKVVLTTMAVLAPTLIFLGLLKLAFALRALFLRVTLLEQRERLRNAVDDIEKK